MIIKLLCLTNHIKILDFKYINIWLRTVATFIIWWYTSFSSISWSWLLICLIWFTYDHIWFCAIIIVTILTWFILSKASAWIAYQCKYACRLINKSLLCMTHSVQVHAYVHTCMYTHCIVILQTFSEKIFCKVFYITKK